ncbi:Os02g0438650 [Oryza sativa Japonica Group]|uniref:Os02g0438650 protein n=1 Tax=Oryza sativa subsp. japonica TaxID=39947 RepID=A0A0P0VII8_ORYSJ|nr:Os02g0438650 [Oryza sativa Japonica Group]
MQRRRPRRLLSYQHSDLAPPVPSSGNNVDPVPTEAPGGGTARAATTTSGGPSSDGAGCRSSSPATCPAAPPLLSPLAASPLAPLSCSNECGARLRAGTHSQSWLLGLEKATRLDDVARNIRF